MNSLMTLIFPVYCAAEQLAAMPVDALAAMGDKAQRFYREHLALAEGVRKFSEIFKHNWPPGQ